jgi:hypothetical protein
VPAFLGTSVHIDDGHGSAFSTATLPNGDLVVAGSFSKAGDVIAGGLAKLVATCPATVASVAPGCPGGGTLTATLPWGGASIDVSGTGLAADSIAVAVLGLGTTSSSLRLSLRKVRSRPCEAATHCR